MNWIKLVQNTVQLPTFANKVINFRVPYFNEFIHQLNSQEEVSSLLFSHEISQSASLFNYICTDSGNQLLNNSVSHSVNHLVNSQLLSKSVTVGQKVTLLCNLDTVIMESMASASSHLVFYQLSTSLIFLNLAPK